MFWLVKCIDFGSTPSMEPLVSHETRVLVARSNCVMCIGDPSSGISVFLTLPLPFPMFRSQSRLIGVLPVVNEVVETTDLWILRRSTNKYILIFVNIQHLYKKKRKVSQPLCMIKLIP